MKILGIDQALRCTGICLFDGEASLFQTIQTIKQNSDWIIDTQKRTAIVWSGIREQIVRYKPDIIVIESPSLGSGGNATRTLSMLFGSLLTKLNERDAQIITVAPTQLKKFATGKGNANKEQMFEALPEHIKVFLGGVAKTKGRYDLVDAYFLTQYALNNK